MPVFHSDNQPRKKENDRSPGNTKARWHEASSSAHVRRPSQPGRYPEAEKRQPSDSASTASDSQVSSQKKPKQVRMLVPEMQRRENAASTSESRPYPTFSKAHSRESVHRVEDIQKHGEPVTPDSTDLGRSRPTDATPAPSKPVTNVQTDVRAPPSPPLTAKETDLRRATSGSSMKQAAAQAKRDTPRRKSADHTDDVYGKAGFSASRSSLRDAEEGKTRTPKSTTPTRPASSSNKTSFLGSMFKDKGGLASGKKTPLNVSPVKPQPRRRASGKGSVTDSDATSVPDKRHARRPPTLVSNEGESPPSDGSRPHTPHDRVAPPHSDRKPTPIVEVFPSNGPEHEINIGSDPLPTSNSVAPPPPPPPPPPNVAPTDVPRVDYLLQHGGLSDVVTREFTSAANPAPPQFFQQYMSPQVNAPKHVDVRSIFKPYHNLLENYALVLSKHGSMAVATGYRSVARRLLDRLEHVFARNISSEVCQCVMCKSSNSTISNDNEYNNGVSWGEVLELVSGRRELPPWPPFSLSDSSSGLGISNLENTAAPMQKLDMDVPEQYREHYIRQSKKTKDAVQKWLSSQLPDESSTTTAATAPPQDVDDETLTFAMLTYLEPDQRRTLTALLRGMDNIPDLRTPTPAIPTDQQQEKPDILRNTARALHRLYRLPNSPRDPECAMYLLKNPSLHSALATLAAISHGEWEILISGRFDGFLWSGAEESKPSNQASNPLKVAPQTPTSRSTTPFSPTNQTPTTPSRPASAHPSNAQSDRIPGPVQHDEDTEIAVLAEVEREIYLGMEALEDAFEALHTQAESIRHKLRERGAGLALRSVQGHRGDEQVGSRLGTPAPNGEAWDRLRNVGAGMGEEDRADVQSIFGGGLLDGRSELAPDDSASNVGWREREKRSRYKKRRPGGGEKGARERRSERRTPAPVEEVDEEEDDAIRKARSSGSERKHRHR